ncbi:MAG: class I SAM-dependent methyltransferase [Planctomycetes bacterium]|nr:class I SAM-dependent methyltransferase [Planctomycetota bacterium]
MFRNRVRDWLEQAEVKRDLGRFLLHFDTPRFREIEAEHRDADPAPGWSKYLNVEPWLKEKLLAVRKLGLQHSHPSRILDIGAGTGYFGWICTRYGHDAAGMDLDEVPLYAELCDFLELRRHIWRVNAHEPLPELGARFDLITAFMICFNGHKSTDLWGPKEWEFFLDDLRENLLNAGGRIFLSFNAEDDGRCFTPELAAFFRDRGGRVSRREVEFGAHPPELRLRTRVREWLQRGTPTGFRHANRFSARLGTAADHAEPKTGRSHSSDGLGVSWRPWRSKKKDTPLGDKGR